MFVDLGIPGTGGGVSRVSRVISLICSESKPSVSPLNRECSCLLQTLLPEKCSPVLKPGLHDPRSDLARCLCVDDV